MYNTQTTCNLFYHCYRQQLFLYPLPPFLQWHLQETGSIRHTPLRWKENRFKSSSSLESGTDVYTSTVFIWLFTFSHLHVQIQKNVPFSQSQMRSWWVLGLLFIRQQKSSVSLGWGNKGTFTLVSNLQCDGLCCHPDLNMNYRPKAILPSSRRRK